MGMGLTIRKNGVKCALFSAMTFINYFGIILLCGIVGGGIFLFRNWNQLFGLDAEHSSETPGARGYGKAQAALVLVLAGKLALMLVFHGG